VVNPKSITATFEDISVVNPKSITATFGLKWPSELID